MRGQYARDQLGVELQTSLYLWVGVALSLICLLLSVILLFLPSAAIVNLLGPNGNPFAALFGFLSTALITASIRRSREATRNAIRFGESDSDFEQANSFFLFTRLTQLRARQHFFLGLSASSLILSLFAFVYAEITRPLTLQKHLDAVLSTDTSYFAFEAAETLISLGVPEEKIVFSGKDLRYGSTTKQRIGAISLFRVSADGHDFSRSLFQGTRFINSSAAKANFSEARIEGSVFEETDLSNSSFRNADFSTELEQATKFNVVNLSGADFRFANLVGVNFNKVIVDKTDFNDARIDPNLLKGMCYTRQPPIGLEDKAVAQCDDEFSRR